jgi:KDO2-lipid IV(A) lauroyltransferase
MKRRVSHYLEYLLTISIVRLTQLLPHEYALRLGSVLGRITFSVVRLRRKVVLENLKATFPHKNDSEIMAIARDTYRNLAMSLVEYARLPVTTQEQMRERIRVDGLENFDKALARGKGAVLVTGHFGSWELMGANLIGLGYKLHFLVGEQSNKAVDNLMNGLRRSQGIGIISMGVSMRQVLKALRANQFVAMLSDQDAGSHGVLVDFLGRPASTPFGPASFAVRTGACVVTGFIMRDGLSKHRVVLEEPIVPEEGADERSESLRLTQLYTSALEKYVREKPDHWLWLHRRWKTKPVCLPETDP